MRGLVGTLVLMMLAVGVAGDALGSWVLEDVDEYNVSSMRLCVEFSGKVQVAYTPGTEEWGNFGDLFYVFRNPGGDWQREIVDTGEFGYLSMQLDSGGHPHISYYAAYVDNVLAQDLRYAWFDGAGWHIEIVDSAGWVGKYTSLALDGSGRPHISYYDSANGDLKYAWHDGTTWHVETVAPGGRPSLALDSSGHPHISYIGSNSTNDVLNYAWHDGSNWHIETVAAAGWSDTSLALDSSGHPHISCGAISGLNYAWHDGSNWHIETVDAVGGHASIALDSGGHPHISYLDTTNTSHALKYAWHDGTTWHVETLGGGINCQTAIALDSTDQPWISQSGPAIVYWLASNLAPVANAGPDQLVIDGDSSGTETATLCGDLSRDTDGTIVGYSWQMGGSEVATGVGPSLPLSLGTHTLTLVVTDNNAATASDTTAVTVGASSAWTVDTPDTTGYWGVYTSLALDSDGHPHISYCDRSNSDLKYAWYDGATWHVETVDAEGTVGSYTSLALDSDGHPHISYRDDSSFSLNYARHDGASWHIEMADATGNGGEYTSLALDNGGHPHISYYDGITGSGRLNYAWHDGTSWHIQRVDVIGSIGKFTSIALDSDGHPHISYYDEGDFADHFDLKYAQYDGTSWHLETVDSKGAVGEHTSLALDSSGYPHISYHDYTSVPGTSQLRYARYDGIDWRVEAVGVRVTYSDAESSVTSLALSSLGDAFIAYTLGAMKIAHSLPTAPPSTAAVFRVDSAGRVSADGSFYGSQFLSGSADIAEWVPVSELVEAGDVLELDTALPGAYRPSQTLCSTVIAGVVSSQPGAVLGGTASVEGMAPLALSGIVPVKVTDEGGPIQPGDLLVSSSTPGYAMRWASGDPCPCALVGKALEPMGDERGVILVLLTAH